MTRYWFRDIDKNKKILEIGPLDNPNIIKNPLNGMNNVYYADIHSTEEIREYYKNHTKIDNDSIVNVDYVIKNSYTESIGDTNKFNYVIMTHVIEHIPDLIFFFNDIANVIEDDGKIYMAIPDKRYCFDHYRNPTSFAEVYEIYTDKKQKNTMRTLDFLCSVNPAIPKDPIYWWKNKNNFSHLKLLIEEDTQKIISMYNYTKETGKYIDAHLNVFTPLSFLLLAFFMTQYSLFPYKIIDFYNTAQDVNEFGVVLEKKSSLMHSKTDRNIELKHIIELLNKWNEYEWEQNVCTHLFKKQIYESETWKIGHKIVCFFSFFKKFKNRSQKNDK